jgi:hypothetical protein
VKVSIREHTAVSDIALSAIASGAGVQTPILIVPSTGFWVYINRYFATQHFMAVTPDGTIYEEHPESESSNFDLDRFRFRALLNHIARKYTVDIPDTSLLFNHWLVEYRNLGNAIYRYDNRNREWKNERIA